MPFLRSNSLLAFFVHLTLCLSNWAMGDDQACHQTRELVGCIAWENIDRAHKLIAKGCPVEFSQKFRMKYGSPLNQAACTGDLNLVTLLLEKRATLESSGLLQRTPLHEAADHGHLPIVEFLCKHGAAIDLIDGRGRTPLTEALMEGRLSIVSYLHQTHGVELANDFLLKIAQKEGEKYLAMAAYLVASGIDPNFVDENGQAPLHFASSKQNRSMAQALIEAKATLEIPDGQGNTALHLAAEVMQGEVWHYLLSLGADQDIKNHQGLSPRAVMQKNYTRELVSAAWKGDLERGREMIRLGAMIDREPRGVYFGRLVYPTQASCQAALHGKLAFLHMLLENNGDVDVCSGSQGERPLYHAAIHNHLSTAEFLIQQKACVNAQDNSRHTALHGAVIENYTAMVKLLLDAQADANIVCSDGSPLWLAVNRGNEPIITLLIAANADPEGNYGPHKQTALHVAVSHNNRDLCQILLTARAQPETRDANGHSVLDALNADQQTKSMLGDLFN